MSRVYLEDVCNFFTHSPMQFENPVFFVPLVAGAILKEQIDIRSTDDVLDVCQHVASNSGCIVKVRAGYCNQHVRCRQKTHARNNTRRW